MTVVYLLAAFTVGFFSHALVASIRPFPRNKEP